MTVHWILFGSMNTGSSRIHGYRIHEELLRQGYSSHLLVSPPTDVQMYDLPWSDPERLVESDAIVSGDTVIFETVRGVRAQRFAAALHKKGVQVCFLECDLYPESSLANSASLILCTSSYLVEEMQKRHPGIPVREVSDPFEDYMPPEDLPLRVRGVEKGLRLVWIGHAGHWETLDEVRTLLHDPEFRDLELTTVSNHSHADLMWCPRTASSVLRSADVLVVPVSQSDQAQAKSGNRVVQGMASGCVVLAGDLPSYRKVIESGTNGFLCRTPGEWRDAFRAVRDVSLRRRVVHQAYQRVVPEYSLARITTRYAELLQLCTFKPHAKQKMPAGMLSESRAEYACWYLAQHRYPEAIGWMAGAGCGERCIAGIRSALKVLTDRFKRKLTRIQGNR